MNMDLGVLDLDLSPSECSRQKIRSEEEAKGSPHLKDLLNDISASIEQKKNVLSILDNYKEECQAFLASTFQFDDELFEEFASNRKSTKECEGAAASRHEVTKSLKGTATYTKKNETFTLESDNKTSIAQKCQHNVNEDKTSSGDIFYDCQTASDDVTSLSQTSDQTITDYKSVTSLSESSDQTITDYKSAIDYSK